MGKNGIGEMTTYAQGITPFPLAWADFLREDEMPPKEIQCKFLYSNLRPMIDKACEILILKTRTITGTSHPQLQKMLVKYDEVPEFPDDARSADSCRTQQLRGSIAFLNSASTAK